MGGRTGRFSSPCAASGYLVTTLLAVDPGVRALGWALFQYRSLAACGASILKQSDPDRNIALHREAIGYAEEGVMERMVWRPNDPKSRPNDLLNVQLIGAAALAGQVRTFRTVTPSEWKGTIPKAIHHKRIRSVLSEAETATLEEALRGVRKSHHKEVLDAIGIGLFAFKRTNKAGAKRI